MSAKVNSEVNPGSSSSSSSNIKRTIRRKIEIPALSDSDDLSANRYQVFRGLSPNSAHHLEERIKNLEISLEQEKQYKINLEQEVQGLLEEIGAQNEANDQLTKGINDQSLIIKTKEDELKKLKIEFENFIENNNNNENNIKKKYNNIINEINDQLQLTNKQKNKLESEKKKLLIELGDINSTLESNVVAKKQIENKVDNLEQEIKKFRIENEEKNRQLSELVHIKSKASYNLSEAAEQLKQAEAAVENLQKEKMKLKIEIESLIQALELSEGQKPALTSSISSLQLDLNSCKNDLEEETHSKQLLIGQLLKIQNENNNLKVKLENDLANNLKDGDIQRKKLMTTINQLEEEIIKQTKIIINKDKINNKNNIQIQTLNEEILFQKNTIIEITKKIKEQENEIKDLKIIINNNNNDINNYINDYNKLINENNNNKNNNNKLNEKNESLIKDNKYLNELIKELKEENKEQKIKIENIINIKNNFENEVISLTQKINGNEKEISEALHKNVLSNMEINDIKNENNNIIQTKNEEIEKLKKAIQKLANDNNELILEFETKFKNESKKIKKNLETEIERLKIEIDNNNRNLMESNKNNKNLNNKIKEMEGDLLTFESLIEDLKSQLNNNEKIKNILQLQIEQIQSKLDTTELSKKNLAYLNEELTQQIESFTLQMAGNQTEVKKKDGENVELKFLLEEMTVVKRDLEEIANKQKQEIEKLNEALNFSEEKNMEKDNIIQTLEKKMREMGAVLEELEGKVIKEERKSTLKLVAKCQGLESDLENEQKKNKDLQNENRKLLKNLQEVTFQRDGEILGREEKDRTLENMQAASMKLKRQLMEAEEVIAIVNSKYKRLQHQLLEATAEKEELEATNLHHVIDRGSSHLHLSLPASTRSSLARSSIARL